MKILILFHYFNRPNLAQNALNSITSQSYTNWDLAVILPSQTQLNLTNTPNARIYSSQNFNQAIQQAAQDSKPDLIVYLPDNNYLYSDYFKNLVAWFKQHPTHPYCISNIVLYDPLTEKPQELFLYPYAFYQDVKVHKFHSHFSELSQIAWQTDYFKKQIKFPIKVEHLVREDAKKEQEFKSSFISQYHATYYDFRNQTDLSNPNGFNISVLVELAGLSGWNQIHSYLLNLNRFCFKLNYYFNIPKNLDVQVISKFPNATITPDKPFKTWLTSQTSTDYLLILNDKNLENLISIDSIQMAIGLLQNKYVGLVSTQTNNNILWTKAEPVKKYFQNKETEDLILMPIVQASNLHAVTLASKSMPINWDDAKYLIEYPDVAIAVRKGILANGWEHYQRSGRLEKRKCFEITSSQEIKPTNPPGWNEPLYLQTYPQIKEVIKLGIFQSGWDYYRQCQAKISQLDISCNKFFNIPVSSSGVNYILATWSGFRRGEKNCESVSYLDYNIKALQHYKHNLAQITIAVPDNPEEPPEFTQYLETIPKTIGNTKVVIFRRENLGQSYGSYCDVYLHYRDQFKYYMLVEDDYLVVEDNFDLTLVRQLEFYPNCGYLASVVYDWDGRPHAAVSNGIAKAEVLELLTQKFGCVPHGTQQDGTDYSTSPQLDFSWGFLEIGTKLEQFYGYQIPYNHIGELRIYSKEYSKDYQVPKNIETIKKEKNIIVPVQFLEELGYKELLS